jgi:HEAT repeat protein
MAVAQVPVSGGGGASLRSLAGTDTLITVNLKGGAQDANLKVLRVHDTYFSVINENGQDLYYTYDKVQSVKVQGGVVETKTFYLNVNRNLTAEEQGILDNALKVARELFAAGKQNQPLRIKASVLLIVNGTDEDSQGALDYLNGLSETNDLKTKVLAAEALWEAGEDPDTRDLIADALRSGDRVTRGTAARLAGLTEQTEFEVDLLRMMQDRSWEISAPAAIGLARLGNREIIPTLVSMVGERIEQRAEAARKALVILGGEDAEELLIARLGTTEGIARFRVARTLHELGNETGTELLREEYLNSAYLQLQAAVLLAKDGNPTAKEIIRERLNRRFDPTAEILRRRSEGAAALLYSGDRTVTGVVQEILRESDTKIDVDVLDWIGRLGITALLPVCAPSLASDVPDELFHASRAVIAIANPEFRRRWIEAEK